MVRVGRSNPSLVTTPPREAQTREGAAATAHPAGRGLARFGLPSPRQAAQALAGAALAVSLAACGGTLGPDQAARQGAEAGRAPRTGVDLTCLVHEDAPSTRAEILESPPMGLAGTLALEPPVVEGVPATFNYAVAEDPELGEALRALFEAHRAKMPATPGPDFADIGERHANGTLEPEVYGFLQKSYANYQACGGEVGFDAWIRLLHTPEGQQDVALAYFRSLEDVPDDASRRRLQRFQRKVSRYQLRAALEDFRQTTGDYDATVVDMVRANLERMHGPRGP